MKRIFVIFLICTVLFCSVGCDGYTAAKKYPYYKADYWYCEELDFAFYYEYYEDGRMKYITYPLQWEANSLNVSVYFIVGNWYMEVDNGDDIPQLEDQILSGTWTYKRGNLILKITEDKIFGGQFQELVFIPMEQT